MMSLRICGGIDFCKTTLKTLDVIFNLVATRGQCSRPPTASSLCLSQILSLQSALAAHKRCHQSTAVGYIVASLRHGWIQPCMSQPTAVDGWMHVAAHGIQTSTAMGCGMHPAK